MNSELERLAELATQANEKEENGWNIGQATIGAVYAQLKLGTEVGPAISALIEIEKLCASHLRDYPQSIPAVSIDDIREIYIKHLGARQ